MKCRKIGRRGSGKQKLFSGPGMGEGQLVSVEELAGDFCRASQGVYAPIDGIACDGATCGGGVDADLMGTTGVQAEFKQTGAGPGAEDFPIGFCRTTPTSDRHPLAGHGVAADRPIPRACISTGPAEDESEVGFFRFPVTELSAEFAVGSIIFRGDENAGGFAIETVNDAGTIGGASGGELAFTMVKEGGGEGSGGATCTGVDVHSGSLVDDEDVLVLMEDVEGKILGGHIAWSGSRNADGDSDFGGEKIAGADRFSREGDSILLHPLLDAGAGLSAESGESDIGPVVLIERGGDAGPDPFFGRRRVFRQFL